MKRPDLTVCCIVLLGIVWVSAKCSGVIYVKWDSPSDGPGTSWDNAYHTIQAGINAAVWEDVWVARGTYNEHIVLKSNIWVYGGFAGSETNISQRPAFPRPESDPNASIINGGGWANHELGHLVRVPAYSGVHTAIDGFTIQNGSSYWNDDDYPHPGYGAGILVMTGADCVITNNLFKNNDSCFHGGAIAVVEASPKISNNKFIDNMASPQGYGNSFGGAIALFGGTPVISNNVFDDNVATEGAALYFYSSNPLVSNNTFTNNSAWNRGGAVNMVLGAGSITGSIFQYNEAWEVGGNAIWLDHSSPVIQNCLLVDNENTQGSVNTNIHCWNASPAILNNTMVGNQGPAIFLMNSNSHINNNIVAFNTGGIWNGGGSSPVLRNNDFYGNTDYDYDSGGGLGPGVGDISADPLFLNPFHGDYRIHYESPCRDAGYNDPIGLPTNDLDGQPRVEGSAVDIGADECWSRIIHVSQAPSASDSNSGDTWQEAKRHIQSAINIAVPPDRIWVARDTNPYYERITVKSGISVFGGFVGTETSFSERPAFPRPSPDPYETIIDAQGLGTAVTFEQNASVHTRLDGFKITHGDAEFGGGVYCKLSSPSIVNNNFVENHAAEGGAVYLEAASPTIESCRFDNNIAVNRGGGIHAYYYCNPLIRYCRFGNCQAQNIDGGAIFADGSEPKIVGCTISDCYAKQQGGAIRLWGSSAILTNNTIAANTADGHGGGIAMRSGSSRLYNNIVAHNSSGLYGSDGAAPQAYHNDVWSNTGYDYYGIAPGLYDISVDPAFAHLSYRDFHLRYPSGCINAGLDSASYLPDFDFDYQGRKNLAVDIGADEFHPPVTYYVKKAGDDSFSGLDWDNALRTVNKALEKCIFGDQVRVDFGVYNERIKLRRGVSVSGVEGFADGVTLDGQHTGSVVDCEPGAAADCKLRYVRVTNGNALNGGGITLSNTSPLIENVTITQNQASEGGGVFLDNSNAVLQSCLVSSNSAQNRGGGIHCTGNGSPVVNKCRVYSNYTVSGDGGGFFAQGGDPQISLSHFQGNTAALAGGAARCWHSTATFTGNFIEWNAAQFGAGIHLHEGFGTITNNTLTDNWVTVFGGAIDCSGANASISNNVIFSNSGGIYGSGGSLTLRNNDVFGNFAYSYNGVSAGAGDIQLDPMFASGSRRLTPTSPCVNAGWNSAPSMTALDMDLTPRVQGGVVDIGAYELAEVHSTDDVKSAPDGTPVNLDGMMSTAAFPACERSVNCFYVERLDRAWGILVKSPYSPPAVGWDTEVVGRIWVNPDGERYVEAQSHSSIPGYILNPFVMVNLDVGGGPLGLQAGVQGGIGTNNIGLLILTCGSIIERDPGNPVTWFRISDGSGATVKCVVPSGVVVDPAWTYVVVRGISSCEKVNGEIKRMIKIRSQSDISGS